MFWEQKLSYTYLWIQLTQSFPPYHNIKYIYYITNSFVFSSVDIQPGVSPKKKKQTESAVSSVVEIDIEMPGAAKKKYATWYTTEKLQLT